ncbi:hypothetical protein CPC08DRAFT_630436 [Agrocybe pediades]|nr:hypothetical protein CPC08DRAFT_630436 [Agrocybe pediades]
MRSFHRPSERRPSTADGDSEQRLGRSTTLANRTSHESRRSPSLGRVSGERFDRPAIPEEPVPPLPTNLNGRPSQDEHRRLQKPHHGSPEARLQQPPRVSGEADRYVKQQTTVPQLPSLNRPVVTQQRIFVVNLQQFHMVEVSPSTSAGDVIALLDSQGVLTGWAGEGGWMIFEVAQDFGMERPVRSYELLADVQSSWIKDKTVNYFVVRLTPFAIPLRRSNIPASSPTHSGYVEWEAKRGKWSKRYLQLREHSLWLSKRDNGKDEIFLCSLSNFDAYHITRAHRAPKPFAFAIKSTDNLSFFEDTADYLHTFSASEKDGKIWMEKILIARSYVLHQERNVLFNPQSTATGGNASAAVTRSGTKKYAARPLQPLVAVPPVRVGGSSGQLSPKRNVFEPGSLLAKHT